MVDADDAQRKVRVAKLEVDRHCGFVKRCCDVINRHRVVGVASVYHDKPHYYGEI
jgi:hypothetical protein